MKVYELFDRYQLHNLANPDNKSITKVDDVDQLAKILEDQCSDILKAYREAGDPIYRGIKGAGDQVIITGIRQDRKPVEMKSDWHTILHKAFIQAGLKATRTNSIFCTTSTRIAMDWGEVYAIFPKNGWTVTIFEDFVSDYTFYELSGLKHHSEVLDAKNEQEKIDYVVQHLNAMGKKSITSPKELADVIKKGYEDILLTGDSYIAVRAFSSKMARKLGDKLGFPL